VIRATVEFPGKFQKNNQGTFTVSIPRVTSRIGELPPDFRANRDDCERCEEQGRGITADETHFVVWLRCFLRCFGFAFVQSSPIFLFNSRRQLPWPTTERLARACLLHHLALSGECKRKCTQSKAEHKVSTSSRGLMHWLSVPVGSGQSGH